MNAEEKERDDKDRAEVLAMAVRNRQNSNSRKIVSTAEIQRAKDFGLPIENFVSIHDLMKSIKRGYLCRPRRETWRKK